MEKSNNICWLLAIYALGTILLSGCSGSGGEGDDTAGAENRTAKIVAVSPMGVQPGDTARVTLAPTEIDAEQATAFYSGQELPLAREGETDEGLPVYSFVVPTGARTGRLHVVTDGLRTNSVTLPVSDISVVSPDAEDLVTDELGNPVPVNLLIAVLEDASPDEAAAREIAAAHSAELVGQIPIAGIYQYRVSASTLEQLRAIASQIETDPRVRSVSLDPLVSFDQNQKLINGNDFIDPGLPNQRFHNRVASGAARYCDEVSASAPGLTRPVFGAVGVIEDDVDYDSLDFSGYRKNGGARVNNISVTATDATSSDSHGTTVTGIIAGQIGTGGTAGLLSAIGECSGGFNVWVAQDTKGTTDSDTISRIPFFGSDRTYLDYFARTLQMLEANFEVINWSWGIHRSGATTRFGADVNDNVVTKFTVFDPLKEPYNRVVDVIERAYPGALIVAAAGNGALETNDDNALPSSIDSGSLLVVGAHTNGGRGGDAAANAACDAPTDPGSQQPPRGAIYTNYGTRVDIVAAGTVYNARGEIECGTSFAAPLVTATVAAMKSIDPSLTPSEIRNVLRSSALPIENDLPADLDGDNRRDADPVPLTAPLTAAEVRGDTSRLGQGARLNVDGAIAAVLERVAEDSVPEGEEIAIDFAPGAGEALRTVNFTVPSDDVFNKVDIVFAVDVSSSFDDDIEQFRMQANEIVAAFDEAGADVQLAVASYSDFPRSPYGNPGDYSYRLEQSLTDDDARIISALGRLQIQDGNDGSESQLEALFRAATDPAVGFRDGSLPIIFLATDAGFHNSDEESAYPGAGRNETLTALTDRGIRVYGLQAGGELDDVVSIAEDTDGAAFLLSDDSSEIVESIQRAIADAEQEVSLRLVSVGDAAGFITDISPRRIDAVERGENVSFNVTFSQEAFDGQGGQFVFGLRVQVLADEAAVLQQIPVTITVKRN